MTHNILFSFFTFAFCLTTYSDNTTSFVSSSDNAPRSIGMGQQPQLSVNTKGEIRVVFGRNDSIFCATSDQSAANFKSIFVGRVADMHLGMTRGPQIASSRSLTLITAMDKKGDIHTFLLDEKKGNWIAVSFTNDVRGSAPEGLMSIAADDKDNFYAVWLDIRKGKKNNIYYSTFAGEKKKWSSNKLVYESPDQHVCECCKPSIAVRNAHIAIMFRNWLNGSRDLYITESYNKGGTFNAASKLGKGTWKLDGCPMDGGGVAIDANNETHTVWRRQGTVYYAKPNEEETSIAEGKICGITTSKGKVVMSMQQAGEIKVFDLKEKKEVILGKGAFVKTAITNAGNLIATWEDNKEIKVLVIRNNHTTVTP